MKTILSILLLSVPVSCAAQAANDIMIRQRNAGNTGFVERTIADPAADSFLRFNNTTNLPDFRTNAQVLSDIGAQTLDSDLTTWAGITPGTGIGAALALNVGSPGAPVVFDGAGGTPSSLTGTNITGTAAGFTVGAATTAVNQAGGTVSATTVDASSEIDVASTATTGIRLFNLADQANSEHLKLFWIANNCYVALEKTGTGSTSRGVWFGTFTGQTGSVGLVAGGAARLTTSSTGLVNVASTTDSTSKDTGAFVSEGGIAAEKNIVAGAVIKTGGFTVAGLAGIASPTAGMHAYVTDATAPTYLGTLTGGGAVTCPVFYNGTAWISH